MINSRLGSRPLLAKSRISAVFQSSAMTTRKRRERKRVSNLIGMDTGGLNDLLAGAKVKKQPSKIKSAPRTRVTRSTSGGRVAFSAPALVTLSDKSDSAEIRVKREKTDVKSESVRRVSKRIVSFKVFDKNANFP